jgi:hypothetical protein
MKKAAAIVCGIVSLALLATGLGFAAAPEKAGAAKEAKAATVTVSAADLDAVAKAVEDANTALAADKKKDAQEKLAEAAKLLAKMKAAAVAAAPAAPAAGGGETFTGTVESTQSQKRPRLVVDGTHYELKPSDKAAASVKDTLAKISKGEATGKHTVKGTASTIDGKSGILVDSITKD